MKYKDIFCTSLRYLFWSSSIQYIFCQRSGALLFGNYQLLLPFWINTVQTVSTEICMFSLYALHTVYNYGDVTGFMIREQNFSFRQHYDLSLSSAWLWQCLSLTTVCLSLIILFWFLTTARHDRVFDWPMTFLTTVSLWEGLTVTTVPLKTGCL
jgi:hypothetical protein